jgi:hypothetical protein
MSPSYHSHSTRARWANEHVELSYQRLERRVCSAKIGRAAWEPAFQHGRPRDCQRRGQRMLPTKLGYVVWGVVVLSSRDGTSATVRQHTTFSR